MTSAPRPSSPCEPPAEAGAGRPRILYCHCTYANVVPVETKQRVLAELGASGAGFDAVADLCEMAARKDPALARLAAGGGRMVIAACFPRAVKWLFHSAGAPLDEARVEVLNMRELPADRVIAGLLGAAAAGIEAAGEAEA